MRSSHRRKNSLSTSLNLATGRRSPSSMIQDKSSGQLRSPSGAPYLDRRRSPTGEKLSPMSAYPERRSPDRRSPTSAFAPIFGSGDRKSPIGPMIPPITISNPSETFYSSFTSKTMPSNLEKPFTPSKTPSPSSQETSLPPPPSSPSTGASALTGGQPPPQQQEKKEKSSVMKEILNFVRKPSKKVTTQTSKFAAAFTRRESGSGSPLMRQSTFSSIPNTSSRAGRNAITKQISEVGFEPKMSLKLKSVSSKMSLRLRRFDERRREKSDKKSSGDEISDREMSDGKVSDTTEIFELDNVKFEKVGETYIKPDETLIEEDDDKVGGGGGGGGKLETIFDKSQSADSNDLDTKNGANGTVNHNNNNHIRPEIEIEPPSRRSSFDPPRSPYLENLRSLSSTDHSRMDSTGESFEIFDSDLSRYQSTSYEDQTSSFEIIESEIIQKSQFDVRKSSIELVDAETFQRSTPKGRKSSLETHFDMVPNYRYSTPAKCITMAAATGPGSGAQPKGSSKKVKDLKQKFSAPRARSPLSCQTSSNYSSRDSYESSSSHPEFGRKSTMFDYRINRPTTGHVVATTHHLGPQDNSSGSEFEPPSPRRAASASPKHTFTFRIVLKKVESSPDAICPDRSRSRDKHERHKRRDSRRKRLLDSGKSF